MIECTHPHTATAERCRLCNGQFIREQAAVALAEQDRELLRLVDEEKLSDARLALRLSISRSWASSKIRDARRREKVRQGMLTPIA